MQKAVVRPAKNKELRETSELFLNVLRGLSYYNKKAKEGEAEKYSEKALREMLKKDPTSVLVAKINGEVVGFCFSYKISGVFHMDWFGIKKECRHRGVGEAIVKAVIESATKEGVHKIICDSRTNNIPSRTFLQKNGFRKFAQVKRHWYKQDYFLWEMFI